MPGIAATSLLVVARQHWFVRPSRRVVCTVASVVGGVLIWEVVARYIVRSLIFLAPPSAVVQSAGNLWAKGTLQQHILVSGQEFLVGFLLAAVVGIAAGLLMATNRLVHDLVDPWVSALYSTPTVALAPLFILWFGLDLTSKVAVVFFVSAFPVTINTLAGVRAIDRALLEVARSFGASRFQTLKMILIPAALPFIVAGLRLGIGRGLVGVVVGELFGARAGLGYLIFEAGQTFDSASLFVGVLILAVTGVVVMELLKRLERRMVPWQHLQERE